LQNEKLSGWVTQERTWDRSEKVVRQMTDSEKGVPKIPWHRQYIFISPISFRDPIYTSRFHFDVKQKKSGIQLI
jgi:hypothetical protein